MSLEIDTPHTPASAPLERRANRRGRAFLAGKIVYGDGYSADCTIRELTETGARIRLPAQVAPRDFHLIVVRDGRAYRAQTVWTRFPEVGLALDEAHDLTDAAAPKNLRNMWNALAPRAS